MNYLWNKPISELYSTETPSLIEVYYKNLANLANKLVKEINEANFIESLKILHGIEEKCRLLAFYLNNDEYFGRKYSSEEIIHTIEQEYKLAYFEHLDFLEFEKKDFSLLYLIK